MLLTETPLELCEIYKFFRLCEHIEKLAVCYRFLLGEHVTEMLELVTNLR